MIQNKPNIRACRPASPLGGSISRFDQNDRTRAVFEALAEKLGDLKAFEKSAVWTHTDFRWMVLETSIGMNAIAEALKPISVDEYYGGIDDEDYYPEEHYFRVPDAGITWQKFGKHFEIIVNDRKKLLGFINAQRGLQYSVYPHQLQVYGDLIFDFTLDQIIKNSEPIKTLGEKTSKLAKIVLENRNRCFSYAELANVLEEKTLFEDYRSKYSYCRSLDKIFERLNRDCKTKIFHYKAETVLVIEPCLSNVGDV